VRVVMAIQSNIGIHIPSIIDLLHKCAIIGT